MTMVNLTSWRRQFVADLDIVEKDAVALLKDIVTEFILRAWPPASQGGRTPVDTGRTQSNWQIAITGRALTSEPRYKDSIGTALRKLEKVTTLREITINNATPYFPELDQGRRSKQAPQGIIDITLEELRAIYG